MPAQLLKDLKDVDEGLKEAKEEGDKPKEEKLEKAQAHFGKELQDYKKEHEEDEKKTDEVEKNDSKEVKSDETESLKKRLDFLEEYYKTNELRKTRDTINKRYSVKSSYNDLLLRAHKTDDDNTYQQHLKEYKKNNPEMFEGEDTNIKWDSTEKIKGLY